MEALIRLFRYARAWRLRIVLATLYSALNKLFDIAPEILIGVAVDVVVKREESFVAGLGFETPESQITVLGIATFVIWALESVFQYLYSVTWRDLAQSLQHALRLDTYDRVQRLDMAFYEDNSVGNLLATINDDVNQLERFLDNGANEIIQLLVSTFLVGLVFFYLEPTIAVLAILPIPLIFLGSMYFQKNLGPRYSAVRDAAGSLGATLANNISGMATIRGFTTEDKELARVEALSRDYLSANTRAIRMSSAFIPLIRMAVLAGFLFTLVLGGLKTFEGTLAVSSYSVLIFLTQRLLWPFTRLGQTIDLFERAMASTRRILDLLETDFTIRDPEQPRESGRVQGEIRFEGVDFTYG
ncbi:MAG: ABC transporter ATP-binding protein, partial [Acidobacteriota bacterium]|nr:ABC transporter ATP-binding protein [Acidobacteriota bacterium]